MAVIEIMTGMGGEKNWVIIWSRGKIKTREPLKNQASRVSCNHSNSIMGFCFLLYVVVVYTL